MKLNFHLGKKKFLINVEKKYLLGKMTGLMFRSRKINNMLFSFDKDSKIALHSWFVFFPFLCLWLDENMNVLEMRVVNPFSTRILPKKRFMHVVEIPFNDDNFTIIRNLVGTRKGLNR